MLLYRKRLKPVFEAAEVNVVGYARKCRWSEWHGTVPCTENDLPAFNETQKQLVELSLSELSSLFRECTSPDFFSGWLFYTKNLCVATLTLQINKSLERNTIPIDFIAKPYSKFFKNIHFGIIHSMEKRAGQKVPRKQESINQSINLSIDRAIQAISATKQITLQWITFLHPLPWSNDAIFSKINQAHELPVFTKIKNKKDRFFFEKKIYHLLQMLVHQSHFIRQRWRLWLL